MVGQKKGPGEKVDPGRNWLPPAERRPAMQDWHGARNVVMKDHQSNRDNERIRLGKKLQEETAKDGCSGDN
jgi:hypothetical protein